MAIMTECRMDILYQLFTTSFISGSPDGLNSMKQITVSHIESKGGIVDECVVGVCIGVGIFGEIVAGPLLLSVIEVDENLVV